MVIITKNFKSDWNWFYDCNCNRYCNCNLGFYEKTLIFQTSNFENLIQGIDALSWGEYAGVLRISKIQILPLQICYADFWTGASGTSGTLVLLVLLVLWFSEFLVLCETRVSLSGESSHWKGALLVPNWSLGEAATFYGVRLLKTLSFPKP
jgi:hypothetical protein